MTANETISLPLLALRRGVLLPGSQITVPVGRSASTAAIMAAGEGRHVMVAVQREPKAEIPALSDLHDIATEARVVRVATVKDGALRVVLEGRRRGRLTQLVHSDPYLRARVEFPDVAVDEVEANALVEETQSFVRELAAQHGVEIPGPMLRESEPGLFADQLCGVLDLPAEKRLVVLETLDPLARLRTVIELAKEVSATWEMRKKIGSEVRKELSEEQRKAILRQQLKAIQRELGDKAGESGTELAETLRALELPEEAREVVDRELARLEAMSPQQPEHGVIRNYLELIAQLPWDTRAEVSEEISAVRERLDADHFGLDDVKKRVLQHLAVAKLSGDVQGTILCLVGPPGVGKTSLAQSVADATGRPLVRVALGGVRDEAEIRGHRRTYVGALPGRIVSALRKVKVKNPVVVLDEIDKLGRGVWGSPEAALLELLDPEQNRAFTDHYLELPFDLSEIMFIATANSLETLSAPLRDRLEIIGLSGYTTDEKVEIANRHLVPKRRDKIGFSADSITLQRDAIIRIIEDYTREAGVRQLDRQIANLFRGLALEAVSQQQDEAAAPHDVTPADVREHLGKPRHRQDIGERVSVPGVAVGLAWTPVGGDTLFIETSRMKGTGRVQITGKLGDVMQESAQAALSYVRSHADELQVDPEFLTSHDIHVHVPAGGTPKDGPSAGVTMFTAFVSLLTGRRVRPDTAMTGECSLRGRVLPVGGIKEKVLAAHRAGLTRVILPRRNEVDLDEVPQNVRETMEVLFVDDMAEVLEAALEPQGLPDDGVTAGADLLPTG